MFINNFYDYGIIKLSNGVVLRRTKKQYYHTSDSCSVLINEIQNEFGSDWTIAQWSDLNLVIEEQMRILDTFKINRNLTADIPLGFIDAGTNSCVKSYNYFASFHNHVKPGYYGAFGNYNNYYFTLGSWYTTKHILCKLL